VPRPQLLELVPSVGDRKFASFAQFFLHKCGTISLGTLLIKSAGDGNGPTISGHYGELEMPLADLPMPMPVNIKSFEHMELWFYFPNQICLIIPNSSAT
jgi:hypothetical protein